MDGITQQKKNILTEILAFFFCCHKVSFMLKKVKSEKFAIIFLILKLRGLKRLEKSI